MLANHYWRMMTEQLEFSVLSAPLASIDRRVLSQAWYSALRWARDQRTSMRSARPVQVATSTACRARCGGEPVRSREPVAARPPSPKQVRDRRWDFVHDRRAARCKLARDIERVFCDRRRVTNRATFTVGSQRQRVHVILQSSGNQVTIVAICSPTARALVATALAQARYALGRRGIVLAVAREVVSCS
jgi:hypothetical protein